MVGRGVGEGGAWTECSARAAEEEAREDAREEALDPEAGGELPACAAAEERRACGWSCRRGGEAFGWCGSR